MCQAEFNPKFFPSLCFGVKLSDLQRWVGFQFCFSLGLYQVNKTHFKVKDFQSIFVHRIKSFLIFKWFPVWD